MIGILARYDYTNAGREAYIIYKRLTDIILHYNMIPVCIFPNDNYKKLVDKCDGIILEGGSYESDLDLEIIKYIYDSNIPCLGICLGMQEMAVLFGGELADVSNHADVLHKVNIIDSLVYGNDSFIVNSNHHSCVVKTDLQICAKSMDGIVEMVEDKRKKFFVGVQWHPENLDDEKALKIFDMFIKKAL